MRMGQSMFQIASRELLDMEKAEGKALVGNQQSGGGPGGPEGALQMRVAFSVPLTLGGQRRKSRRQY